MPLPLLVRARNLKGARVLLRVDFNVPVTKGKIDRTEDFRIRSAIPTIKFLLKKGATVIILSHRGRPKGKLDQTLSLKPVARRLETLLKKKIHFGIAEAKKIKPGEVAMLENLRFDPREEKCDKKFAKELAKIGDIFVQDGFAVAHRRSVTTTALPRLLPSYAGLLLEKEILALDKISNPKKPFVAMIGGVKLETKIGVIQALAKKADAILIGGALANVFFAAKCLDVGSSLLQKKEVKMAEALLKNKTIAKKLVLPIDVAVSAFSPAHRPFIVKVNPYAHAPICASPLAILDIGPHTIALFSSHLSRAKTIVWNGPMGYFEDPRFARGTHALAREVASRGKNAFITVGGGETVQAIAKTGMMKQVSHVSTGGGAMLEYLAGEKLPGVETLRRAF